MFAECCKSVLSSETEKGKKLPCCFWQLFPCTYPFAHARKHKRPVHRASCHRVPHAISLSDFYPLNLQIGWQKNQDRQKGNKSALLKAPLVNCYNHDFLPFFGVGVGVDPRCYFTFYHEWNRAGEMYLAQNIRGRTKKWRPTQQKWDINFRHCRLAFSSIFSIQQLSC